MIAKPSEDYRLRGSSVPKFWIKQQKSSCAWPSVNNTVKLLSQAEAHGSSPCIWALYDDLSEMESPINFSLNEISTKKNPPKMRSFLELLPCLKHLDHQHDDRSMWLEINFNDLAWQIHKSLNISENISQYIRIYVLLRYNSSSWVWNHALRVCSTSAFSEGSFTGFIVKSLRVHTLSFQYESRNSHLCSAMEMVVMMGELWLPEGNREHGRRCPSVWPLL